MAIFTSATTRGFYDDEFSPNMPHDAVSITSAEHQALLNGQSEGKSIEWDADGYPYLKDPVEPTLVEKQAAVWQLIKEERDRRTQLGGYQVDGNWFHSDTFSRSQIIALVVMGENMPEGLNWKTMDGNFVSMTPTLAQQIFAAAAAQDQAVFGVAETHKANMLAEEDPYGYDYLSDWPVSHGE